jgi:thiol-disulfide isomerase/thioredoxin
VGHLLERPFVNTRLPKLNRDGNGFIMGLALGLVFVPCAGPILASITVLAATNGVSWGLVVLTLSFSVGIAIPLLVFGVAGQAMGARIKAVRTNLSAIRITSGVILMLTAVVIATNVVEPLQRAVPGFLANAQSSIEDNQNVRTQLDNLAGRDDGPTNTDDMGRYMSFDECSYVSTELHNCGPEHELTGLTSWLNTPGNKPLNLEDLKGKVVLIDFWTYSCINCQRTFPYITGWYDKYKDDGLVVIGVHTPEFGFEKVESNVAAAAKRYGVDYPIALDNDYATWDAWGQRYWPAHYLIDQTGMVRQVHYGEGNYGETEMLIQQLLKTPPEPTVAPTGMGTLTANRSPESYVGYGRAQGNYNDVVKDTATNYTLTTDPPGNHFSIGGTWTVGSEYATAGKDAEMNVSFYAADAHLVIAGTGTVTTEVLGDPSTRKTITVSGEPDLYTLWTGEPGSVLLHMTFSEGLQAYAFTFG